MERVLGKPILAVPWIQSRMLHGLGIILTLVFNTMQTFGNNICQCLYHISNFNNNNNNNIDDKQHITKKTNFILFYRNEFKKLINVRNTNFAQRSSIGWNSQRKLT